MEQMRKRIRTGVILIPDAGCWLRRNNLFIKAKAEQTYKGTPTKGSALPCLVVVKPGLGSNRWLLSGTSGRTTFWLSYHPVCEDCFGSVSSLTCSLFLTNLLCDEKSLVIFQNKMSYLHFIYLFCFPFPDGWFWKKNFGKRTPGTES